VVDATLFRCVSVTGVHFRLRVQRGAACLSVRRVFFFLSFSFRLTADEAPLPVF
jgi:hypothetical protein